MIGGMLAATFIAPLFTPLLFLWSQQFGQIVRRRFARKGERERVPAE